jgi:type IV pilus assembly protein PilB
MNILEILAQKKIISAKDIVLIKEEVESSGMSLEEVLVKRGVDPAVITKSKAEYLKIPARTLESQDVPFNVLQYIPEESALHYRFVPLSIVDNVLEVGLVEPDNIEARDALNFISSKSGLPFKIFLISEQDFEKVLNMYKNLSGEVTKALTELETELVTDKVEMGKDDSEDFSKATKVETKIIEDAPVTKIVATILRYATEGNASDVHIEHMREKIRVRFRVDGILNTSLILPPRVHAAVTARIKILSNMRLDEKRKPQDGRFSARIDGRKIDFRVSTFPTYYGEKVVMRILDQEKGVRKLEDMGLSKRNLGLVREAITKPYGLILISGPTGSGKTTTLYSMLNEIDREELNVLSLEDPIEYNIDGMSQSQVRPEIGYTFANGLRTTLRQDPDVIMVGEIRDKETAQLAIQASLTGHLVLSTIHTNNAMGVIPRLIDMGVDPYLIAPTLILAIAQRLAGVLCKDGAKTEPVEGSIRVMIDKQFADLPEEYRKEIKIPKEVYKVTPTAECPTGTRGRIAVFEVIEMDRELEAVILKNPTELDITKHVRYTKGTLTMKEDAMIKAFDGIIPFEEVNKL